VPLVLGITFIVMMILGIDLHRHHARRPHHRAGAAGGRRHHRGEMMVVKMEEGSDRAAAAAFRLDLDRLPDAHGTLVTAAGFLPVGFANSSVGEYAGGIFWVVADRARGVVVRGGDLHAVSRGKAPGRGWRRLRPSRIPLAGGRIQGEGAHRPRKHPRRELASALRSAWRLTDPSHSGRRRPRRRRTTSTDTRLYRALRA
jgi:hypothetical protein